MDKYVPKEITDPAKREAENFPALSGPEEPAAHPRFERRPRQSRGFGSQDRIKMKTMGQEAVQINRGDRRSSLCGADCGQRTGNGAWILPEIRSAACV